MAGPLIEFGGGIFTDKFIAQPLIDPIRLSTALDPNAQAQRFARIMTALKDGVLALKAHYEGLQSQPQPKPSERIFWPTFRGFGQVKIEYTNHDTPRRYTHGLFSATCILPDTNGQTAKVKVKFTPRYCREAHELLASRGMAPKLYHCEQLAWGWLAIVMEDIGGDNLHELANRKDVPPDIIQAVRAAVQRLHDSDFVFGDLRPPNVVVRRVAQEDGSTQWHGSLVDFDWAGKAGEAKYPVNINTEIEWAEGVCAAEFIKKEHDLEMLQKLETYLM